MTDRPPPVACDRTARRASSGGRRGASSGGGLGLAGALLVGGLACAPAFAQSTTDPFASDTTGRSTQLRGAIGSGTDDTRTTRTSDAPAGSAGAVSLDPEPSLEPTDTAGPAASPASAARTPSPTAATGITLPGTRRRVDPQLAGSRVEPILRTGTVPSAAAQAPVVAEQPRPRDADADKRAEYVAVDEAYAPLGLRAGSFVWLPAVEVATGTTSNAEGKARGHSSLLYRVAPELVGRSDWSRHETRIDLRGSYDGNDFDGNYDKPRFRGAIDQRIDLSEGMRLDAGGVYAYEQQSNSSGDDPTHGGRPSNLETKSATLGVTRDAGLVALTLRGGIERYDYSGGTTASGASAGVEVQNNTRALAALRATIGSPGTLRPFVEIQASHRTYDSVDTDGLKRDSTGAAIEGGVSADLGPMLRGEIATGWGIETPEAKALPRMSGWLVDGSLVWSPTRLTSIKLTARSSFEPTTLAGSSGALSRTLGFEVEQALRPELSASAGLSFADKDWIGYDQRERTFTVDTGLTYRFDRHLQSFVRGEWSRFASTTPGADYDSATVMVGLRVQR